MTISHNAYWAYGLHIHSDIECPELPADATPVEQPDVTIRLGEPIEAAEETLENKYYEVRPDSFQLAISGVARYSVDQGSRITIEPVIGAPPAEVRLFLLGSSMGALLYQRGLFPLHGSAVETPWGAMIFVGEQGAGKSTLAAEFHRRGYRLLSDDVCAVRPAGDRLEVLPALAHFRVCADAYERLGTPQSGRFDVDKFVVPMGEGYCPHPVFLKAIHILADHDDRVPELTVLRGFDRVGRLLENLYRPEYLKGQETQTALMKMAGVIAQKSTMAVVARRRDAEAIGALAEFLETEWASRFGEANTTE